MCFRYLNACLASACSANAEGSRAPVNVCASYELLYYKGVSVCGLAVLLFLAIFAPSNVNAMSVREYTGGRFTFTGSVGLEHVERKSKSASREVKSGSFSTVLENRMKGFVWDPRFMVFSAGLNFRQTETSIEGDVGSQPRSVQYSLHTTWLPKRRNPFVLHMNHTVTTVTSPYAPTYGSISDTLGMRWGLRHRTLGSLRFIYGMKKSVSTGESTDRYQLDHSFKVTGVRKLKSKYRTGADLSYGYLFDNKENRESDSQSSEHRLYLNNRTNLTPKIGLSAEGSYFNRLDDRGGQQRSLQSLRASSSLSVRMTEEFNTNYGLSVNASATDSYDSNSVSGSASMNYRISERWNSNASLSIVSSSSSAAGSGEVASSAGGGLTYGQQWGIYNFSSSYSLGISSVLSEPSDGYMVSHGLGIGLSQAASPLWQDGISYSFGYSDDSKQTKTSISHGLTYRAKSRFSIRDSVDLTVNYKQHSNDSSTDVNVNREARSTSSNVAWTHKLAISSTLTASAGYTESDNSISDGLSTQNKSKSARLTYNTSPFGLRNLRFRAKAKYQENYGNQRGQDKKYDTELNLGYKLGRWVSSFKYVYSNNNNGGITYENQTITINIERYFGVRF